MENAGEDDEITLLRQSQKFLKELGDAFENIENVTSERDLDTTIRKIEPYQEDPQLLDSDLGRFISLLSDKFLHNLQNDAVLRHISQILYTFCKVRGEKVIVGLLNNEPRWIEPLLEVVGKDDLPWEENYILLLWLSHLMLSPFDLATISSFSASDFAATLALPDETPSIAKQVLQMGLEHLSAPTIERKAASSLLVRLCVRKDMLDLGIIGILIKHAIQECRQAAKESMIHACLGTLTLLSGLVASADQKMLGSHLSSIFRLAQRVLEDDSMSSIKNSAIARKLVIKILRNTVVHCLQAEQSDLETTEVVEQVIGALIELLADSDTPVRMAASKALSLVTLKLDTEMAAEVIEAVNASFHEELVGKGNASFFSVNAAKWHGVVLTFGHLLQRRALGQAQIPDVLKSVLYALSFEQRSTAGKSVGSNVRDAANYGLWAVARRCTTAELQAISAEDFAIEEVIHTKSSIQYIALNLLVSACFDPDGNVRRGSSAALQELIGRHPNTIEEGIALVQVVDYQAVGLRARSATKVALAAAKLDIMYERTLFEALFTWRGLSAASEQNRVDSAVFAGLLVGQIVEVESDHTGALDNWEAVGSMVAGVFWRPRKHLAKLRPRDQEHRQGLLLASSWVLSALNRAFTTSQMIGFKPDHLLSFLVPFGDALSMAEFAHVLSEDFKPRAARSELSIAATLRLFGQLAGFLKLIKFRDPTLQVRWEKDKHFALLDKCLSRSDEIVLEQVPTAITLPMTMLSATDARQLVKQWLFDLAPENKKIGVRENAKVLALGAAFVNMPKPLKSEADGEVVHALVLDFLLQRYIHVDTDAKIWVLQSLRLILAGFGRVKGEKMDTYLAVLETMLLLALHDYTISERGDVGSLVRLAGLAALQEAWSRGLLLPDQHSKARMEEHGKSLDQLYLDLYDNDASRTEHLSAIVLRLSLEKLDKVRLAAVECWRSQASLSKPALPSTLEVVDSDTTYMLTHGAPLPPKTVAEHDVFSTAFFYQFLTPLTEASISRLVKLRILEGFCTTAGGAGLGASQNLLNAREALHLFLTAPSPAEDNRAAFISTLKDIISINTKQENDQRLVSILEVAAFAAECGLLLFSPSGISAKSFLANIQRSHYQSKNIRKLQVCLDVYRGLANVQEVRKDVLKLVVGMLLHPIPAVRIAAAETFVVVLEGDGEDVAKVEKVVLTMDWTRLTKDFRELVVGFRKMVEEDKL